MNNVSQAPDSQPLLARLAHLIVRRRRIVIAAWVVLTLFGETTSELPFRLVKSTPVGDDGVTILVYQPVTPETAEGQVA
jgi:hypothetical protein